MTYRLFLIVFIISVTGIEPLQAQEQAYRVELLVLRHLDGAEDIDPEQVLRDFSEALDLMPPPEPETDDAEDENADKQEVPETLADAASLPGSDNEEDGIEPGEDGEEGPRIILHEDYSDTMRQAWRRLRSSAGFRPEFYLSWEQPDEEPYETIRVHDLELLFEDDPFADLRAEALEASENAEVPVFSDVPMEELPADEAVIGPELPDPIRYYRIDGTARLSRSRFLHLDLDIEYRVPDYSEVWEPDLQVADVQVAEDQPATRRPHAFTVHRIAQNRQVQTRNIEYFDGPVIAVLALISRIEPEPDVGESEPAGPTD